MKVVNRLKSERPVQGNDLQNAEETAVSVFGFLAGEPEYFSRFASLTGIDLADIGDIASSRAFLTAVIDYVLADEPLLLAFCENHNCRPEAVVNAGYVLGGNHGMD